MAKSNFCLDVPASCLHCRVEWHWPQGQKGYRLAWLPHWALSLPDCEVDFEHGQIYEGLCPIERASDHGQCPCGMSFKISAEKTLLSVSGTDPAHQPAQESLHFWRKLRLSTHGSCAEIQLNSIHGYEIWKYCRACGEWTLRLSLHYLQPTTWPFSDVNSSGDASNINTWRTSPFSWHRPTLPAVQKTEFKHHT